MRKFCKPLIERTKMPLHYTTLLAFKPAKNLVCKSLNFVLLCQGFLKLKVNVCPIFNIFVEIATYPKISIFFIFSCLEGLQAYHNKLYSELLQLNYVKNICIQLHGYLKTSFCDAYARYGTKYPLFRRDRS